MKENLNLETRIIACPVCDGNGNMRTSQAPEVVVPCSICRETGKIPFEQLNACMIVAKAAHVMGDESFARNVGVRILALLDDACNANIVKLNRSLKAVKEFREQLKKTAVEEFLEGTANWSALAKIDGN